MVRVRLEISIFPSPTEAYGHVVGEIELEELPKSLTHFPWPDAWVEEKPFYFTPEQSLIASVGEWTLDGPSCSVSMYGIVCESLADAKECAKFFARVANFEVIEYS